jgi:hypothetical protein
MKLERRVEKSNLAIHSILSISELDEYGYLIVYLKHSQVVYILIQLLLERIYITIKKLFRTKIQECRGRASKGVHI